jgi:putative membrane protein
MSETESPRLEGKSLAKGLVAGLIGGLVGTLAKTLAERMFPPRTHGEPEPPEVAAENLAGHPLDEDTTQVAAEGIHWGFGAAVGAAYGVIVEYYPAAASREGASFGVALEGLTHEKALPALGLAAEPDDQTTRERASEITSHVVYGVTTEFVRKIVRKIL